MRSQAGVATKMFKALGEKNINIQAISTSEIKISVLIDKKFTEEGWCKVDHQSTENFIIGTLITPKIAIIEVILKTV